MDTTMKKIRKLKKVSFNTTISQKTHKKFIKYIKKNHHGVVKGTFSYETEKAIKLLLELYDN